MPGREVEQWKAGRQDRAAWNCASEADASGSGGKDHDFEGEQGSQEASSLASGAEKKNPRKDEKEPVPGRGQPPLMKKWEVSQEESKPERRSTEEQGLRRTSGMVVGSAEVPELHQPWRRRNMPSKMMIMARIAHHRKAQSRAALHLPPSCRTKLNSFLLPTGTQMLPASGSKRWSHLQPGKPLGGGGGGNNQSTFWEGEKSNTYRQRHRRRELRPGPSMLQIYRDAKRKPEEIRVNLLNKCN